MRYVRSNRGKTKNVQHRPCTAPKKEPEGVFKEGISQERSFEGAPNRKLFLCDFFLSCFYRSPIDFH